MEDSYYDHMSYHCSEYCHQLVRPSGPEKNHWLSKINETLVIYQLSLFKVCLVTQKIVTAIQ